VPRTETVKPVETKLQLGGIGQVSRTVSDIAAAEGPVGPESILYLRVPDMRAAYQELRSRGVEFTAAPHLVHKHGDGTEEWMAFFKDPDGRPLAIMSQAKA
jgi:extradiol dioxygenase family protein